MKFGDFIYHFLVLIYAKRIEISEPTSKNALVMNKNTFFDCLYILYFHLHFWMSKIFLNSGLWYFFVALLSVSI